MSSSVLLLGLVVLACPPSVAALPNASLLWRTQIGCLHWGPGCWVPGFSGTDSSPASLLNDSLAIGAYGDLMIGGMFRVDKATGAVRWKTPNAGGEGSPAVSQAGVVYTSTYGGFLALSPIDGKQVWKWTPPDGGQIGSSGALDEARGLIFVGTLNHHFYAVNTSTGTTAWAYSTSDQGGCTGEVWSSLGALGSSDSVYFGTGGTADVSTNCSAALHRVDKDSGALRWKSRTGIQIQGRAGMGRFGSVYVGDYDNCLYAFEQATGARKWKTCTNGRLEASSAVSLPSGKDEVVVIGSGDGYVYCFDGSNGSIQWKQRLGKAVSLLGGGVGSSAAIYQHGDGTWVAAVGGPDAMWGLEVRTGQVQWKWQAPSGKMFGSSPLVEKGKLYVGGEDGYLYALRLP